MNDQMTLTVQVHVLSLIRIGLQFLVAPAAGAEIVGPLRRVGQRTGSAVEVIRPRDDGWRGGRRWRRRLPAARRASCDREDDDDPGVGRRWRLEHLHRAQSAAIM